MSINSIQTILLPVNIENYYLYDLELFKKNLDFPENVEKFEKKTIQDPNPTSIQLKDVPTVLCSRLQNKNNS